MISSHCLLYVILEFGKPAPYSDLSNPSCYLGHVFKHVCIWQYSIINGTHCVCPTMSDFAILPSLPCGTPGAVFHSKSHRNRSTGDRLSTITFSLPYVASGVQETTSRVNSLHSQCSGEGRAWAAGLDTQGWLRCALCNV